MKTYILIFFLTVLSTSTHSQTLINNNAQSNTHYIGELFGGGIIYYLYQENGIQHGLIVSLSDLSTSQVWSNDRTNLIGVSAQSRLYGMNNSKAIVAQEGHKNSAASLCLDYSVGEFDDWYLPSRYELDLIYKEIYILEKTLPKKSFADDFYWSSTESYNSNAWCFNFDDGKIHSNGKYNTYHVRAIRSF